MRVLVGQPPRPDLGKGGSIIIGDLSQQEFADLCSGLSEAESLTRSMADDAGCGDCGKWPPVPRLAENAIRDLTDGLRGADFRPVGRDHRQEDVMGCDQQVCIDDAMQKVVEDLKAWAQAFPSRAASLAVTKIEEAQMWLNQAPRPAPIAQATG